MCGTCVLKMDHHCKSIDASCRKGKKKQFTNIILVFSNGRSVGKQLRQFHQLQIFCTFPGLRAALLYFCVDDHIALFHTVLGGELRSVSLARPIKNTKIILIVWARDSDVTAGSIGWWRRTISHTFLIFCGCDVRNQFGIVVWLSHLSGCTESYHIGVISNASISHRRS